MAAALLCPSVQSCPREGDRGRVGTCAVLRSSGCILSAFQGRAFIWRHTPHTPTHVGCTGKAGAGATQAAAQAAQLPREQGLRAHAHRTQAHSHRGPHLPAPGGPVAPTRSHNPKGRQPGRGEARPCAVGGLSGPHQRSAGSHSPSQALPPPAAGTRQTGGCSRRPGGPAPDPQSGWRSPAGAPPAAAGGKARCARAGVRGPINGVCTV